MAGQTKVKINQKDIERAEHLWDKFMVLSKYCVIGTAAILLIMAAVFVDW